MLLDIDGCKVTKDERTCEFFLRVMVFTRKDYYGVGGADALVATP